MQLEESARRAEGGSVHIMRYDADHAASCCAISHPACGLGIVATSATKLGTACRTKRSTRDTVWSDKFLLQIQQCQQKAEMVLILRLSQTSAKTDSLARQ